MALIIPEQLRAPLSKPLAIFGAGLSGVGVLSVLRNLGLPGVVYDRKDNPFGSDKVKQHDLVVFSPGFEPNHPWLVEACDAGLECMCELDFASYFWQGQVLAITGTNGKTTLAEFLTHALRMDGVVAHAAGNIGRPFSKLVADTAGGNADEIAICEVSSFQAETLHHMNPDATIWANFAEDHLDRHPGMEAYFTAKWNLVARTKEDGVLIGSSVQSYARQFNQELPSTAWVATENATSDAKLEGTVFESYPQRENFILAAAWWSATKRDMSALYTAARCFSLRRHRLKEIGTHKKVSYWNDSKATNFHAVESALGRFAKPVHLIMGGKAKGGDIEGFVKRIGPQVKEAFLIGEVGPQLAELYEGNGAKAQFCDTLEKAVQAAAESARSGDQVVLSPGFASFDQFQDFESRGNKFEELVRGLGSTTNLG